MTDESADPLPSVEKRLEEIFEGNEEFEKIRKVLD